MNRGTFLVSAIVAAVASSLTLVVLDRARMATLQFEAPLQWTDSAPLLVRDIGHFEIWRIDNGAAELIEIVIPLQAPRYSARVEHGCYSLVTVARDGRRSDPSPISCSGGATASLTGVELRYLLAEETCAPDVCLEATSSQREPL